MADSLPDSLPDSIADVFAVEEAPDRALIVVNRESPEPIQRLFEETFENVPVEVSELSIPEEADDLVFLLEDGALVARSTLAELQNAVLLVNVDLYKTGSSGIDKYEAPDVVTALDEQVFTLRGFPASMKEKLLLVVVSRFIERRALQTGAGRLDVSFQRLSRLDDEYGTAKVYERLGATDVDVHLYGQSDGMIPEVDGVTVHAGDSKAYRRSWLVVFDPPETATVDPAALVAYETGPNTWTATLTYDPARVDRVQGYVEESF